ncbi:MAG: hypothetical protein JXB88_14635 [Spirochaetales bacterium]|nr:hypothetical protein [Spirochaetales bacterium]
MNGKGIRLVRDFTRVYSVSIQSGITQPIDIVDTVTVKEISFYKSNHLFYAVLIFLLILYSGVIFLFSRVKQYKNGLAKKIQKVVLACRDINVDRNFDEETKRIIHYIGENYCKHDLTVDALSRGCRIPVVRIPQCLKKHFGLSFPHI